MLGGIGVSSASSRVSQCDSTSSQNARIVINFHSDSSTDQQTHITCMEVIGTIL